MQLNSQPKSYSAVKHKSALQSLSFAFTRASSAQLCFEDHALPLLDYPQLQALHTACYRPAA